MAFSPRLNSIGMVGNLHWYTTNNPYYPTWGLPNCTCYAWGRFWEIGDPLSTGANKPDSSDLPGGWSGGYWWNHVNRSVYQTGNTPALGAVICFEDTTGGDGHVAIVEQINNNGESIVTSNSAWGRADLYFYTMTLYRSNNYCWGGNNNDRYVTQGFIYNPYADIPTPTSEEKTGFPWVLYASKLRNKQSLTKHKFM